MSLKEDPFISEAIYFRQELHHENVLETFFFSVLSINKFDLCLKHAIGVRNVINTIKKQCLNILCSFASQVN